jgi:glycine/D-amino acid oxidase-like deaminating enzyme
VVGGGIFGCTAAIYAARAGHDVHLFEAKDSLLRSASGINQFRLHAGFHYPRSPQTIEECKRGAVSFSAEYRSAIIPTGRHYYAIASGPGSQTSALAYLDVLRKAGLNYKIASLSHIDADMVDVIIHADEYWIDPVLLRGMVYDKLGDVSVHVAAPADGTLRDEFDRVVIATYSGLNDTALMLDLEPEVFQYELCEKPLLRMPPEMNSVGIVIMDGEYCSLDPFGNTGLHVLGHVKHSIHTRNVGLEPLIPDDMQGDIDAGVVYEPEMSKADLMIDAAADFIPAVAEAEYIGSMFTVRAVLPLREKTDERPTLVTELDGQVIRVFSGKIGTAVDAAKQVLELLGTQSAREAA